MSKLVVEDIGDDLASDLSDMAASNGISVDAQVRVLLRRVVPPRDRTALIAELDAIAAMTPKDVVQTDSLVLLREDRDR